jgi:hypothetical protein
MAMRFDEGYGFLTLRFSTSHSDSPQSVGLLRKSDQLVQRPLLDNT